MEGNLNNILLQNGTILPDGTLHKDKINLLSGAYTPDFAEMVWTITDGDPDTIGRMTELFTSLYSDGRDQELLEVIRLLYGVVGLSFPQELEELARHAEARQHYLFEFLLDFDDVIQDLMAEEAAI